MALRRRAGILLLVLVAVHPGPASALNAPLSREAFEAAVAEGQSRKKKDLAASYLLGTRQLRNSTIEVFLATPYAFVWYTAAGASRKAGKFNKEALWSAVREKKTVHLLITTISSTSTLVGGSMEKGYPVVQRVAVRVAAAQEVHEYGPLSQSKVKCGSARHCQGSLGMNWGTLVEYPAEVFSGPGDIEILVDTPLYQAAFPVPRRRLMELPESRWGQNAVP